MYTAPGREGKMEILVRILKAYCEKMKSRRGGESDRGFGAKVSGSHLSNAQEQWVFEDFQLCTGGGTDFWHEPPPPLSIASPSGSLAAQNLGVDKTLLGKRKNSC